MNRKTIARLTAVMATISMLAGCAWLDAGYPAERRSGASTSLVGYLYPDGEIPPDVAGRVPHLELPLHVGLAFVPTRGHDDNGPTEADKVRLLERVRAQFEGRDDIDSIRVIPESYLRGASGVRGMQQVARVFDVDVMALVSYDQVARTTSNTQSLMYWTIVGAYLFEGTDHETRTFVDLAVVDVATSKLLLRAPGFDERRGDATLVGTEDAVLRNRLRGFDAAAHSLSENLAVELAAFEQRLQAGPEDVKVSWRSGGGSTGATLIGLLAAFAWLRWRLPRRRRQAVRALPLRRSQPPAEPPVASSTMPNTFSANA